MTVPEYQALMLPLLKIASNGIEHSLSEVIETLYQCEMKRSTIERTARSAP